MTRKHFQAIAQAIRASGEQMQPMHANHRNTVAETLSVVANQLADVCAQHNPQFNRARFLAACGIES